MKEIRAQLSVLNKYPFLAVILILGFSLAPAYAQTAAAPWSSLNWAGYVAEGGVYTSVSGSWVVPSVPAASGKGDAQWVGIGGMGQNQDLIQAGTQAYLTGDTITYFAWYELLPSYAIRVPLAVHAGDSMSTTITQTAPDTWQITIRNATTGDTFEKTVTYHSSLASAEWIEEMVSNANGTLRPIDNFGSVSFTGVSAIENGVHKSLGELQTKVFTMQTGDGSVLANATPVSADGTSFTVNRTTQSTAIAPAETPSAVVMPTPDGVTIVLQGYETGSFLPATASAPTVRIYRLHHRHVRTSIRTSSGDVIRVALF